MRRVAVSFAIVFVWVELCYGAGASPNEGRYPISNSSYLVSIANETQLVVYDLITSESYTMGVKNRIANIEICPNYPYVSFTALEGAADFNWLYYILDLEQKKLYEGRYFLDIGEKRFSTSGKYTYFNNQTSVLLIETARLREYLSGTKMNPLDVKIAGHPLGMTWQVAWIGDNILYGTGIESMECLGYFDTTKRQNYFMSCCGQGQNTPCDESSRQNDVVIKSFVLLAEKNELKRIGNDLYEYVLRSGMNRSTKE